MSCGPGCLELAVQVCESPEIRVDLPADTALMAILQKPGSTNIYKREILTDGTGGFTLDKDSIPAGYFGYGYINIKFKKGELFDEDQPIGVEDSTQYNCLLLEIADIDE